MAGLDEAATGRVLEICCVWEAEGMFVEFCATQSDWTRRGALLPRDLSFNADCQSERMLPLPSRTE